MLAQRYALDPVDAAIVELLRQDSRAPFARIGRSVSLSAGAVGARVTKLIDDGVLRIVGAVRPESLGFTCLATVLATYRGDVRSLAGDFRGQPNVTFMAQLNSTRNILCEIGARDDAELADLVSDLLLSCDSVEDVYIYRHLEVFKWQTQGWVPTDDGAASHSAIDRALDDLDVSLLWALVDSPRASFRDLAQRTGEPYWVVRKRTQALFADGLINATAMIDKLSTAPEYMANIAVSLHGDASRAIKSLAAKPEVKLLLSTTGMTNLGLEVTCTSATALGKLIRDICALDGVAAVESRPYTRILKVPIPWRFDLVAVD